MFFIFYFQLISNYFALHIIGFTMATLPGLNLVSVFKFYVAILCFFLVLLMKLYSMGGHETFTRLSLPVYNVEMGGSTVDTHRKTDVRTIFFCLMLFPGHISLTSPPFFCSGLILININMNSLILSFCISRRLG